MQLWEHNIEGRYTKQKQKQWKHNAENWKDQVDHYKNGDAPKDDQRRPLQKPGTNVGEREG